MINVYFLSLPFCCIYKIIIGVIVEVFSLIPSLLLVQLFRRIRSRHTRISPLRQALYKIKPQLQMFVEFERKEFLMFLFFSDNGNKQKSSKTFPWWCIFVAYGLCVILVGLSVIVIIARGIEFGDEKTQKWLTSILSGFFSSIFLTQPLKVTFFAFLLC
jgi:hypothetical protein